MAGRVAEFLVRVKSLGQKKAIGDIQELGRAVDSASEAHNRAGKASDNFHNRQAKGVIGTANSTKVSPKWHKPLVQVVVVLLALTLL